MNQPVKLFIRRIAPLFLVFLAIQATAFSTEYEHQIKLRKMSFEWKIKGKRLFVRLAGNTRGWVGIGFNPGRKMQDADFVLGYVEKGKVRIADAFGIRSKEHIHDVAIGGKNNISDVSGNETGNNTTIEFSIPLNSRDSADTKLDTNGYTTVLLGYGWGKDNFIERHRYRTRLKVNLVTGEFRK